MSYVPIVIKGSDLKEYLQLLEDEGLLDDDTFFSVTISRSWDSDDGLI